jgi:putative oxidoreductase
MVTGIIFITHGVARLYFQSVPSFGQFLSSQGLPLGTALAWVVTLGEIISGSLLVPGLFVRYAALFHFVVIACGMLLVHGSNGWFVVGHGTNGVEYSVLLLVVLAALMAWHTPKNTRPQYLK